MITRKSLGASRQKDMFTVQSILTYMVMRRLLQPVYWDASAWVSSA
jgi:hypothetical protein